MFKKDIHIGQKSKLKSSAQRAIRSKFCETYPLIAPYIDNIVPKKAQLDIMKIPDASATLYVLDNVPLFFQHMDDPLIPHLTLVHKYPDLFPRVRVDRGAVRFVLSGATLMVPGLTSPGGRLPANLPSKSPAPAPDEEAGEPANGAALGVPSGEGLTSADDQRYYAQPDLATGTVVVVEAEGKERACCVGVLKMGTREMKGVKKGVGIEGAHYLGDGLWKIRVD